MSNLRFIAVGSFLVLSGGILGKLFEFLFRLVVARSFTVEEYGQLILLLSVIGIGIIAGGFGVLSAISKFIVSAETQQQKKDLIGAGLVAVGTGGLLIGILIYVFDENIAAWLGVADARLLWLSAVAIPFALIIRSGVAIFIGFKSSFERAFYSEVLLKGLRLLGALIIVWAGLSFKLTYEVYVAVTIVVAILVLLRLLKKRGIAFSRTAVVGLVAFSMPLYLSTFFDKLADWADSLIVGHMIGPDAVAHYNSALPLAQLTMVVFGAIGVIALPVLSEKQTNKETQITNALLSRWAFVLSFPLIAFLIFNPEVSLSLFGKSFVVNATILQVLVLAYAINMSFGFNGIALVSQGMTNTLMLSSSAFGLLNIALNWLLIPTVGIIGSAVALLLSLLVRNGINTWALHRKCGFPLVDKKVVPSVIVGILVCLTGVALDRIMEFSLVAQFLSYVGGMLSFTLYMVFGGSVDQNEKERLLLLMNKLVGRFKNN
ncbi:MAG: oligosaccharide flippase family protein [Cryomorphaceae bacterium]